MQYQWQIKTTTNAKAIEKLSEQLNNLDPTLTNILLQRDIDTFEKAKDFFRPDLKEVLDPFLMKDMDRAVERLQQAIANNEKILIYGDYDVDGTTSVALVYAYLKNYYENLAYYIPDRYAEGYGISYQGIDFAKEHDFKLIIALDCGIKAIEKVAYAKEKDIDFIICDHHRPGDNIPDAAAVLDPKRKDCNYPYKELSGCGVGFKLMQAWTINNKKDEEFLYTFLDLLAISICADIVPVTGENRIFVYYGLKVLNQLNRPGIKALVNLTNNKKEFTVSDVVFSIAPRINAAGRIKSGNKAVELLVSDNEDEAVDFGKGINDLNTDRKDIDSNITQEALEIIEKNTTYLQRKTTVLYKEDWHKGVVGIVASRLIETYYKPTIVLTHSDGKVTGSARSVRDFDVYNAIDACSDLLEQYGGHMYAAGLTMLPENVPAFIDKFEDVVSSTIEDHMLIPKLQIDAKLELTQITPRFYSVLKQFSPCGPENMQPVFVTENLLASDNMRIVGENHLKLEVYSPEAPDYKLSCIAFKFAYLFEELQPGVLFSMVYTIEENEWNNTKTLQLNVKDVRLMGG